MDKQNSCAGLKEDGTCRVINKKCVIRQGEEDCCSMYEPDEEYEAFRQS
jgi:hypothetical protein